MENISFDIQHFGCVLTSNQRYIVLLGGCKFTAITGFNYKTIFVLDMNKKNNWKLRKSRIHCPMHGSCKAVRTGGIDSKNEKLVIGFVKSCFKMKELEHLSVPPQYIMMLIVGWYSAEM
eukprot:171456_1